MHLKQFFNQETRGMSKALSVGILLLTISLIVANVYLFLKSRPASNFGSRELLSEKPAELTDGELQWETYIDEKYAYSISYPSLLEPREIESDNYLRFIIFFVPSGVEGPGFGVSVRENSLKEEVELIKQEIGLDSQARLIKEDEVLKGGFPGKRLEFEPIKTEEGELKTVVIINNEKYSYTISSTPDFIDEILEKFNLES